MEVALPRDFTDSLLEKIFEQQKNRAELLQAQ